MLFENLGPYKIKRLVGRGGMGSVYEGVHRDSGLRHAIKTLAPALCDNSGFRQRFEIEILSMQVLDHPNIVRVIPQPGTGDKSLFLMEQGGVLFYAMEFVEGLNLHQLLKERGRLPWKEVVKITVQVCAALKHAHAHGVIHRDLKPANLLMDKEGTVKLTDFGIARLFGSQHLTADHSVIGTADYMAPEQAEGKQPTIHSDLYSLGSVIYALMTGKPPFSSKVAAQVIHKLRYSDPQPMIQIRQDIPIEFDRIVMQLLHKTPSARIPTAVALGHRLQAMLHALGPTSLEEGSLAVDPKRDTDQQDSSGSGSIGNKLTKEGAYTGMEEAVD
ncbi:MAG TPA: serine/threonine protein kinase, partial [Planctomycetaceae bacterium]|nr:serine/threonine protein kinase [Planctomycetaceae bacterium]